MVAIFKTEKALVTMVWLFWPRVARLLSYGAGKHQMCQISLVPRRSPPLSGEREGHVRAWERVGVPAGERSHAVSFGDVTKFRAKSISGKGTPGY